jgi:methionyl-tRNA synthetase
VNRVLGFAYKRYDGKVPHPAELDDLDRELLQKIEDGFETVARSYEQVRLRDALKEAMALTRDVNKYLDVKAPWTVFKTDPVAAGTSTYVAMRAIDSLKTMFAPVLPNSAEKVHQLFGGTEPLFGTQKTHERNEDGDCYPVLNYNKTEAEKAGRDRWRPSELAGGTPFGKPEPLYSLLEQEMVEGTAAE